MPVLENVSLYFVLCFQLLKFNFLDSPNRVFNWRPLSDVFAAPTLLFLFNLTSYDLL